jgi:hypothetical protein
MILSYTRSHFLYALGIWYQARPKWNLILFGLEQRFKVKNNRHNHHKSLIRT